MIHIRLLLKVARLDLLGSIPPHFERLPQLHCIKMKICYDPCFIDIRVIIIAT